jgi:peroxin-10
MRAGDPAGDAGPSSRGGARGGTAARPRRFPTAAQPEVMRAAEKDDSYAAHVTEACRDAFRHIFGLRTPLLCLPQSRPSLALCLGFGCDLALW